MRIVIALVAVLVCLSLTLAAGPTAKPGLQVSMNTGGMEGMKEVVVQPYLVGEANWLKITGYTTKDIGALADARVKRISGLKAVSSQSLATPRLLVQVIGHTIPGYDEKDPPAVTHMTVALSQNAIVRRGARNLAVNAQTYTITMLSTGKASSMRARVKDKLDELLGEFAQDYHRANAR